MALLQAATTSTVNTTASPAVDAAPSHQERRQSRHKKASDPFLELDDNNAVQLPDPPSRTAIGMSMSRQLLVDLLLTPINMVVLLLSLFLVDHKQRQWRLSQHASSPTSLWARLSPLGAEPYQDSHDRRAVSGGASVRTYASASDGSFTGWYRRTKHRSMAKLDLSDALEMRGRVLVALVAWLVLGLFGFIPDDVTTQDRGSLTGWYGTGHDSKPVGHLPHLVLVRAEVRVLDYCAHQQATGVQRQAAAEVKPAFMTNLRLGDGLKHKTAPWPQRGRDAVVNRPRRRNLGGPSSSLFTGLTA
ncbi:hypothetical protein LTR87_004115 [Friedmanniomyces endolithicus]|nr:hypothetical protein LTR87_004115 [Friedmanniomyces endolithicus]